MADFKKEKQWYNDVYDLIGMMGLVFFSAFIVLILMYFTGHASEVAIYFAKLSFYSYMFIGALGAVLAFKVAHILSLALKKKDSPIDVIINDPEAGYQPLTRIKYFRGWWMVLWSLLAFSFIGFLASTFNLESLFIYIVPSQQEQVSPIADILFNVEPAVSAETLLFLALLVLFPISKYLFQKTGINMSVFWFVIVPMLAIFIGFCWMIIHTVYDFDETKRFGTFVFGTVGSAITMYTGQAIIWWIWHYMNNLFYRLFYMADSGLIGNEWITTTFAIIWGSIFVVAIFSILIKKGTRKTRKVAG